MKHVPSPERSSSSLGRIARYGAGAAALLAGLNSEGCATTRPPDPVSAQLSRYGVSEMPSEGYEQEELVRFRREFQHWLPAATGLHSTDEDSVASLLEGAGRYGRIPMPANTYNEVRVESDWPMLADLNLGEPRAFQEVEESPEIQARFDALDRSQGIDPIPMPPPTFDRSAWSRLANVFGRHHTGTYQLHFARLRYDSRFICDDRFGGGGMGDARRAVVRYSDREDTLDQFTPSSPRLSLEWGRRFDGGVGVGPTEEYARSMAMASFIQELMYEPQPSLERHGTYLLNPHAIHDVTFTVQSSAYYLQRASFHTERIINPRTGRPAFRVMFGADVFSYRAPSGTRWDVSDMVTKREL